MLYALLIAALLAAWPAHGQVGGGARPRVARNVFVVMIDDIDPGDLSVYDGTRRDSAESPPSTPAIEALAAAGVTFEDAYTAPMCGISRRQFLLGTSPILNWGAMSGATTAVATGWSAAPADESFAWAIEAQQPGVARVGWFGKAGWTSNAGHCAAPEADRGMLCEVDGDCIGTCDAAPVWPNDAPHMGFHRFEGIPANYFPPDNYTLDVVDAPALSKGAWTTAAEAGTVYLDDEFTTRALAWIDAIEAVEISTPWLVVLSLHGTHGPFYDPADPAAGICADQDACRRLNVQNTDANLARVVTHLSTAGGRDRLPFTQVILVGDNGRTGKPGLQAVSVPLVIAHAGVAVPGVIHQGAVGMTDLHGTILETFGAARGDLAQMVANRTDSNRFNGQARITEARSLVGILSGYCATVDCSQQNPPTSQYHQAAIGGHRALVLGDHRLERNGSTDVESLFAIATQAPDLMPPSGGDLIAYNALVAEWSSRWDDTIEYGVPFAGELDPVTVVLDTGDDYTVDTGGKVRGGYPLDVWCEIECDTSAGFNTAPATCAYPGGSSYDWTARCGETPTGPWDLRTGTFSPPGGAFACNDGIDNDGDWNGGVDPDPGGGVDYPDDLGCWGPLDDDEAFRDATKTGPYSAGTTLRGECIAECPGGLTTLAGGWTSSSIGDTLECRNLTDGSNINVQHDDVVVSCNNAVAGGTHILVTGGADDVVIEDNTIDGGDDPSEGLVRVYSGTSDGTRIERNELRRWDDGIKGEGAVNLTVRDNYIHTPRSSDGCSCPSTCQHNDAFEFDGGGGNSVVLEGNNVVGNYEETACETSLHMLDNWSGGDQVDFSTRRNSFVGEPGGGSYTVYCDGSFTASLLDDIVVIDNIIRTSQFGYATFSGVCSPTQHGNVDAITGAAILGADTPVECNDGIDNDADGKIDWGLSSWNDPGCSSGVDNSENTL